jgi:dTDP-glucose pyrophosphorylase
MTACNSLPYLTFIVEDSHIGREGALLTGATLIAVEDPNDVTEEKILGTIDEKQRYDNLSKNIPWKREKWNVLIPMAGAGSRFAAQGYTFPKPLIEVNHKPMIQVVVENLNIDAHYIYLIQREHYDKYNLKYLMNLITPNCDIVLVDGLTEGAACTTLLAKKLIDNDNPLVIANSDQFVEWNSNEVMYAFSADGIDGGILAFHATHPKWSYVSLDQYGFAKEIAEKKVISEHATVGIYFWKKGSDYVKYAEKMIDENDRTNNEFYVAPTFNYAINEGKKIRVKYARKMYGLGTPEDLNYFLTHFKEEK